MPHPDYIEELGMTVLPHHLRRVIDLLMEGSVAMHEQSGLKTPVRACSMMTLLLENGPLGITEIAGRLRLSHPHIIRKTAELESLGLVRAVPDDRDQRRRVIQLTPSGKREAKTIRNSAAAVQRMNEALCAEIGVDLYDAALRARAALEKTSCLERLQAAERMLKGEVA